MKLTLKNISLVLMLGAFVLGSTACNTVAGVGKDTQKVGEEIEDAADGTPDNTKSNPKN